MRSLTKHLILIVLFFSWTFLSASDKSDAIAQEIQHHLQQSIEKAASDMEDFYQGYLENPSNLYSKSATYPIYILKGDSLVFWSSFQSKFELTTIQETPHLSVLDLGAKSFLLCKQRYDNDVWLVALVPLQSKPLVQNSYLKQSLNESIFDHYKIKINPDSADTVIPIVNKEGQTLFEIEVLNSANYQSNNYSYLIFFVIALFGGYLLLVRKYAWWALAYLLVFRGITLFLEYPSAYFSEWLFDPKVYAASSLSPTLGDFFLNSIIGVVLAVHCSKAIHTKILVFWAHRFKGTFAVGVIFILALTEGFYVLLLSLYRNSQYDFNFFDLTTFPALEVLYGVVFILLSYIYMISVHAIIQLLKHTFFDAFGINILAFFLASVVAIVLFQEHWHLFVAIIGLMVVGIQTNLPKSVVHFTSTTYVYVVLLIICASWVAFAALRDNGMAEEKIEKSKFADQILNKHDPLGEYLLSEALKDIDQDAFIKSIILDPSKSKSVVYQKVQNIFLNKYFDRYNVDIHLFNNRGISFDESTKNSYLEWEKDFGLLAYATEYDNVYFHDDVAGASGRLVGFSNIVKNNKVIGSLVIDMTMKRVIPSSVYPKLLLDEKMTKGANTEGYFYAFYKDSSLAYSFGNYNYPQDIINGVPSGGGYDHYLQQGEDGELVVVTSMHDRLLSGNFSYHFLLITFTALLWSVAISIVQFTRKKAPMSFAVKIRLFLGGAFFIPLIIITLSLVGIINTNYRQEKEEEIVKTSEGLNDRLATLLDQYNRNKLSLNELANNVNLLSIHSGLDQNIYEPSGRLLYSSQPEIFETGLISKLMNPQAYQDIILQSKKYTLLNEKIEELNYNAIYWAIHSNLSGELIAVLHLPFYNAKEELANREFAVFSIVINVFSLILILTVLVYPLTINSLTGPLKLIAAKLKKTSFSGENEKIEWRSQDELGMLVQQYNEMISKLEESREELAKQEKEHAWREMAQQVAHEIKNPLTPMKLTLQHLQRTEDVEAVKKAIAMMLTQVETLNDIATSFSSFAKMPEPETTQYNLSEVVKKSVQLYENEVGKVTLSQFEEGVVVNGDEKLMGRILTNLILNGIQSTENGVQPEVEVALQLSENKVLISIKDNGEGIPEDIKDKVFIPNFSTKYSGSGIGLAVAKRGVEHAGGKISFETRKGEGTTFYIQLPIIKG